MPASPRWCRCCPHTDASRTAGRRRAGRCGGRPVRPPVRRDGDRAGALPAAAPGRRTCRRSVPERGFCWRNRSWPTPRGRWKSAARPASPPRSRWASKAPRCGCKPPPTRSASAPQAFRAATELAQERGRRAVARYRTELAGKRMFLFPDSQLEIPLARFVSRELSMRVIEAGTPYLHRQHLAEELALLPDVRCPQRRPGCRAAAGSLPRRQARSGCLRPGTGQSAGGRGPDDEMVDRTAVHAGAGLRPGRRPGRTVRPPAGAAHAAGGVAR